MSATFKTTPSTGNPLVSSFGSVGEEEALGRWWDARKKEGASFSGRSMMPLPPITETGPVSRGYVDFLDSVKYIVLGLYLVVSLASIYSASFLFERTELKWEAPAGSYAAEQLEVLHQWYPFSLTGADTMILMEWADLKRTDDITLIDSPMPDESPKWEYPPEDPQVTLSFYGTRNFTLALQIVVYDVWCGVEPSETVSKLQGGAAPDCLVNGTRSNYISAFSSYWNFAAYDEGVAQFLSAANRSSIAASITLQGEEVGLVDRTEEFEDFLNATLVELSGVFLAPLGMAAQSFSIAGGVDEAVATIVKDLAFADGVAIPLSLLLMMIALRNIRLMVWPLVTIVSTTLLSAACVAEIARIVPINVVVAPFMISLVVGLPVGHALFMLNRFREALLEGEDARSSTQRMLSTAGATICLSQFSLASCVAIIIVFTANPIRGFGFAMLVCVVHSSLSSLLLGPCLVLSFPSFFERAQQRTKVFAVKNRETIALTSHVKTRVTNYSGRESVVPQITPQLHSSFWHRFASVTQMRTLQNWLIVAFILLVTIPFGVVLFKHTPVGDSFEAYLPRDSAFTKLAHRTFRGYGYGVAATARMVVLPPEDQPLTVSDLHPTIDLDSRDLVGFPLWEQIATELVPGFEAIDNFPRLGSIGGYYSMGAAFNTTSQVQCGNWFALHATLPVFSEPEGYVPSCNWRGAAMYSSAGLSAALPGISKGNRNVYSVFSSVMTVKLSIDPLNPQGMRFVSDFKALQAELNGKGGVRVYLAGSGVNSAAAMDAVKGRLGLMAVAFSLIVFFVVLAGTSSVFVAWRAVLTTFLTISFSLGLTSLTFCHGAFDWTSSNALSSFTTTDSTGMLHYTVLIVGLPLIIGFCICHELFIVTACMEWYHYHFLETSEAIKMAVVGTAWMNILSGFILAVSFLGHMFSRLPLLNQVSFAIFWATIFDVLLVRTILVPTLMAPWGKYNWWPAVKRRGLAGGAAAEPRRDEGKP
eukprot:gene19972-30727_t